MMSFKPVGFVLAAGMFAGMAAPQSADACWWLYKKSAAAEPAVEAPAPGPLPEIAQRVVITPTTPAKRTPSARTGRLRAAYAAGCARPARRHQSPKPRFLFACARPKDPRPGFAWAHGGSLNRARASGPGSAGRQEAGGDIRRGGGGHGESSSVLVAVRRLQTARERHF